jgi:hypothetical protein
MEILRKMQKKHAGRRIYDDPMMSTRRLRLHAGDNVFRSL